MAEAPTLHFKECNLFRTEEARIDPVYGQFFRATACTCRVIHERIMIDRAVQSYLRTHPDEAVESGG